MQRFHVSLGWRTDAGTLATAGLLIVARDEGQAKTLAAIRIRADARRRFGSNMQTSAVMLPEEPSQ
jgi:hypothetical protein